MGKKVENKTKKKSKVKKIILRFMAFVLIILGVIAGIFAYRYNYNKLDLKDLGINSNNYLSDSKRKKYKNIALFGVDSRYNTFEGLSDSIMVLTLDYEHKSIKLTSFMRDSLVKIEGHGYEKQTHAYNYGGARASCKNSKYKL